MPSLPMTQTHCGVHSDLELSTDTLSVKESFSKGQPRSGLSAHLWTEINPRQATYQMSSYCFMTGYIGCVSFSAIFIYCGFQTGNLIQLAIAIAREFQNPSAKYRDTRSFHKGDQQALTSIIAFNLGACFGRVGDRMGCKTRIWLVLGTMMQALFTMAATLALWRSGQGSLGKNRGDPSWTDALTFVGLSFLSASMGLQGIVGRRLNTEFGTTIVLTTAWLELITDPKLFTFGWVKSREHRIAAIFSLFLGAFLGRALVDVIGMEGALGIATGLRVIIALSWLFVPKK